jgi:GTP-binding protein
MFRVAVVGRPNVGKSSLFNRLTQTRRAIVGNEPGITRDRLYAPAEWFGRGFEVVDTGGIVPESKETMLQQILAQAETALNEAALVLLVVDVRAGVTPLDQALASFVRSRGKDYLLVVNKVDAPGLEEDALEFFSLGVESIFPVSAEHKQGIAELVEEIIRRMPEKGEMVQTGDEIGVAIIGRPNVGKSSLLNRLLGHERAIVTDIPGTTRDAVDTVIKRHGRRFRLVDTAGIRRKGKTELMAEKLSVVMARKHMERADVVLLLLDASEGAARLDAVIGGYAHKAGKSILIAVNKWDLVEHDTHTAIRLEAEFRERMRFLDFAPMSFISAKTGQRVQRLLEEVGKAHDARCLRVPTAELNQFLEAQVAPAMSSFGAGEGKAPLKYAAQIKTSPPTFVFFTRGGRGLHFSTERFLVNQLRQKYGFFATPIRIIERAGRPRKKRV